MNELLPISPTFERRGSCNRMCGRCCTAQAHIRQPDAESIHQEWFNPPFIGLNERGECAHLEWINGKAACKIYESRPQVCRTFPVNPDMLKDITHCTYTFEEHYA